VLNQIAAHFLNLSAHLVPNWLISNPDPNVSIGFFCKPYQVEMVIRGYLSGHAWREYKSGKRIICGVQMPEGLKENDKFPEPIITPTIKAVSGHDEDISREEIISTGLVPEEEYQQMEVYTRKLYEFGSIVYLTVPSFEKRIQILDFYLKDLVPKNFDWSFESKLLSNIWQST
jgi:phosphoribosylaminoimidazole-succinocarboxamide synthase